jgi:hypothetical protein
MTGNEPPAPDAPDDESRIAQTPMPTMIWVECGPVRVMSLDTPRPHFSGGACQCPACRGHDPDPALRFY